MKILITGVHGFVGSNMVKAWKGEHEIYGLDIVSPTKDGVKATFGWDSLNNPEALPEFDAIVHLAGKAHDTKNKAAAEVYFQVNTELTKKIYDFFLKSSAKKFVFFSTVKAAADSVEGLLTEDVEPKPVGPYGESKIAAERYILEIQNDRNTEFCKSESNSQACLDTAERRQNGQSQIQKSEKQFYIFRSCMIHGPGNKGNLNLLYSVVRKGIPWPLGAFDNKRTFSSIDNVTYVVNELLRQDVESGIYHMADDEAVSTNELIELICESLGKKAHIWKLPKGMMNFGAKVGGWLRLPLNSERLRKLTEDYCASNAKVKKAIGIEKMPITATEGLKRTLRSFAE